ncbi:MAG TPA: hypothetical protein VM187_14985 [Niastella sp.]|nr:hypothetical protein [Niastella sp.]
MAKILFSQLNKTPVQNLTVWDLVLTPIYLVVLTYIAKQNRDKRYPPGHVLRKYYLQGLYVKFAGAIFIALIYEFYYGGGDTYSFYKHSKIINSALSDSFENWFYLIIHTPLADHPHLYPYISQMEWYNDVSSYTVAAVSAVFGLINGNTYLPIALLFAYFSFTGIWAMYKTFVTIYPKLHKELAIAFLFIPSTFVWGSAIFKDTICMFGLGWLTYTSFRIFVNRDFSVKNIALLALSFYLIYTIKIYILLAFLPALSIWLLTTYSSKIQSAGLRFASKGIFIVISLYAFLYFSSIFSEELERYSLENIAGTAATTRSWISYASGDEGSSYDLGEFDPSIEGMLLKFPQAVTVTLFRPFPWEGKKLIVLFSSLEAMVFIYFTLKAFFSRGILISFQLISKDSNLLFFLVFSLIFAFAVGISSYNFGALSRYKIPCLPFYAALLIILQHSSKNSTTSRRGAIIRKSGAGNLVEYR